MVSRSSFDILKGADIEQNAARRCANVNHISLYLITPVCVYIYPRRSVNTGVTNGSQTLTER